MRLEAYKYIVRSMFCFRAIANLRTARASQDIQQKIAMKFVTVLTHTAEEVH